MELKLIIEILLPIIFLASQYNLGLLVIILLFIVWGLINLINKGHEKIEIKLK